MRIFFAAIAFIFTSQFIIAQVGFTGAYFSQQVPDWEKAALGLRSNEKLLSTGYSGEIDFKFAAFENYRIVFYPALSYQKASSTQEILDQLNRTFDLTQYEFNLKTNIFLLSLEADCDCPTFSRDASLLEKGFFVQIAPGLSYFQAEVAEDQIISDGNGLAFKLGLGIGLEIGLNDYVTITPLVKYNRYFNMEWNGLQNDIATFDQIDMPNGSDKTNINQFYAGLKVGFRFSR